jgi:hypothetical protein
MPSPKPIVTRYNRAFHRVLLVLELVPAPFATIPDWAVTSDGVTTDALLTGAAALHARFWRLPAALRRDAAFLYDQTGLSFLGMVRGASPGWRHVRGGEWCVCPLHARIPSPPPPPVVPPLGRQTLAERLHAPASRHVTSPPAYSLALHFVHTRTLPPAHARSAQVPMLLKQRKCPAWSLQVWDACDKFFAASERVTVR